MDVDPRNTPSKDDFDPFCSFQKSFKYHKSSSEISLIISTFGLLRGSLCSELGGGVQNGKMRYIHHLVEQVMKFKKNTTFAQKSEKLRGFSFF